MNPPSRYLLPLFALVKCRKPFARVAKVGTAWNNGPVPATAQHRCNVDIQVGADGHAAVVLSGALDAETTPGCWARLEEKLERSHIKTIDLYAESVNFCDGSGIALLRYLSLGGMTEGAAVTVHGLKEEWRKQLEAFTADDYKAFRLKPQPKPHVPEEVGIAASSLMNDLREQVSFIGSVAAGLFVMLWNRKRMRWPEVKRVFELSGANALPIVSLISLLVGLIIAFESVQPLAQFGAQIYIANMIGLMMVRELGPLMTAIMLAGRSSSAFAAEIGTMKVNEELNALETMGLDPIRFLVIQRIVAAILLAPLLTAYSMAMGILGGVIVMRSLGFPLTLIYTQLISSLEVSDILLGMCKGLVFGIIVAMVGCLRGLQTKKGPSAVGESTTRAVVTSIVFIIVADAVFSVVTYVFER